MQKGISLLTALLIAAILFIIALLAITGLISKFWNFILQGFSTIENIIKTR